MGARNRVGIGPSYRDARACICKRLWSPGIDSEEMIPPGLQIRAQATQPGGIGSLDRFLGSLKFKY
jgi:hypothetical protein